jgi:glycosyltransferase involved in cell wall biosynthesis
MANENVWLIKSGEPLQTDIGVTRLMRTAYLSEFLSDQKATVTWWTSSFNHQKKTFRCSVNSSLRSSKNINIRLINSPGYTRNVSISRWFDDIVLAWGILKSMNSEIKPPTVIVCSYPLIFVAYAVSLYAKKRGIPFILDVRDMWPDIFTYTNGRFKKLVMHIFCSLHQPFVKRIFSSATGIVGITDSFINWSLQKANRKRNRFDRVFPLTSKPVKASETEINAAKDFWEGWGISPSMKIFCYFGVFSDKVDLYSVIEAAGKLSPESNVKVVLCGTGDDFEKVAAFGENVSNVIFPGWIDAVQIRILMEMSIGGLAPFKNRIDFMSSLPNKVIEYLSSGLPIISGIDGEIKQLIEKYNCGVVYQEKNIDSLVLIFQDMAINDDYVKSISNGAILAYEKEFDFDRVYNRFATHVLTVIGGSQVDNKGD